MAAFQAELDFLIERFLASEIYVFFTFIYCCLLFSNCRSSLHSEYFADNCELYNYTRIMTRPLWIPVSHTMLRLQAVNLKFA